MRLAASSYDPYTCDGPMPAGEVRDCGVCERFVEQLGELDLGELSLPETRDIMGEFFYRPRNLRRRNGVVVCNGCEECPDGLTQPKRHGGVND